MATEIILTPHRHKPQGVSGSGSGYSGSGSAGIPGASPSIPSHNELQGLVNSDSYAESDAYVHLSAASAKKILDLIALFVSDETLLTLKKSLKIDGDLSAKNITVEDFLKAVRASFEQLSVSGKSTFNEVVASVLSVSGKSTLGEVVASVLSVTGKSTLSDVVASVLSVTGKSTLSEVIARTIEVAGKALFKQGLEVGRYTTGAFGSGASLKVNGDGKTELEVDDLTVRRSAVFRELVIEAMRHIGGELVLSPARMICSRVEDKDGVWRCYIDRGEQKAGRYEVEQEFTVGSQARCQVFTGSGQKYYWRLVTSIGDDWVELSKTDADGTGAPTAGDNIVEVGHRTDVRRQSFIILSAYGSDAPSFKQYWGVNSYSLVDKEVTKLSPLGNLIKGDIRLQSGKSVETAILDTESSAKKDAAEKASAALTGAKQYADNKKEEAIEAAKTHTDTQFSVLDGKITSSVKEIKIYADKAVEGVQIGTDNLLKSGNNLTDWIVETPVSVRQEGDTYIASTTDTSVAAWGIYQDVQVEGNTEYVLTISINNDKSNAKSGYSIGGFLSADNNPWNSITGNTYLTNINNNHYKQHVFRTRYGDTKIRIYLCGQGFPGDLFAYRWVTLKKGNKASLSYSPSLDELTTRKEWQTSIEQTKELIATKASLIELDKVRKMPVRPNLLKGMYRISAKVIGGTGDWEYYTLPYSDFMPGKRYVASARVTPVAGDFSAGYTIIYYRFVDNTDITAYTTSPDAQGRVSFVFQAVAPKSGCYERILFYAGKGGATSGHTCEYADFKLEEISPGEPELPTAYLPAVEDLGGLGIRENLVPQSFICNVQEYISDEVERTKKWPTSSMLYLKDLPAFSPRLKALILSVDINVTKVLDEPNTTFERSVYFSLRKGDTVIRWSKAVITKEARRDRYVVVLPCTMDDIKQSDRIFCWLTDYGAGYINKTVENIKIEQVLEGEELVPTTYVQNGNDLTDRLTQYNSKLEQTAKEIRSEVSKKVGNDEVISRINQTAETVKIQANKVEIDGEVVFGAVKGKVDNAVNTNSNVILANQRAVKAQETADGLFSDEKFNERINRTTTKINGRNITTGTVDADKLVFNEGFAKSLLALDAFIKNLKVDFVQVTGKLSAKQISVGQLAGNPNFEVRGDGTIKFGQMILNNAGELVGFDSANTARMFINSRRINSIESIANNSAFDQTFSGSSSYFSSSDTSGTEEVIKTFSLPVDAVNIHVTGSITVTRDSEDKVDAQLVLTLKSTLYDTEHYLGSCISLSSANTLTIDKVLPNCGHGEYKLIATWTYQSFGSTGVTTIGGKVNSITLHCTKTSDLAQVVMGIDGIMALKDGQNYMHYSMDTGLTVKGKSNVPGILAAGTVRRSGGVVDSDAYGKYVDYGSYPYGTADYQGNGRYKVYHSIGHSDYTVQLTAEALTWGGNKEPIVISWFNKTSSYFEVVQSAHGGNSTNEQFSYIVIGQNKG